MLSKEVRGQAKAITEGMFKANPKVQLFEVMKELEANNLHLGKTTVCSWLGKLRKAAEPTTFPFEQIMETIVRSFEEAKKVPLLTETINRQDNIIAAQKDQIKKLDKDLQEAIDMHRRYKVAIQQGEVPELKNKERP